METVEINFEDVTLLLDYNWFNNHCQDLNICLENKDKYANVSYSIFEEINKRYLASKGKTLCWIVTSFIGNECLTSGFNTYKDATLKKNELELHGYTTCIHYGYM